MSMYELYKKAVEAREKQGDLMRGDPSDPVACRLYWEHVGRVDGIISAYAATTGMYNHDARDVLVMRMRGES